MKKIKFRWLTLALVLALVIGMVPSGNVLAAAQKYKISYVTNGGTLASGSPKKYTYGKGVTLKNPTRLGYSFSGWYKNKSFTGKKVKSLSKTSKGNKKFYAKWTPYTYNIKFDGNGHTSGTMDIIYNVKYNEKKVLTPNTFQKRDYIFNGWNTSKNGEGIKFTDAQIVKGILPVKNGTVTLYAQWATPAELNGQKEYFRVSYIMNGGVNSSLNPATYAAKEREIILKNPVSRPGYTFEGWYSDAGYYNRATKISLTDRGDKTFFAKWNVNKYTVRFNANGGTGIMSDYVVSYDQQFYATCYFVPPAGKQFIGWSLYPSGSDTLFNANYPFSNLTSVNNQVVVLYAQWDIPQEPEPDTNTTSGGAAHL